MLYEFWIWPLISGFMPTILTRICNVQLMLIHSTGHH